MRLFVFYILSFFILSGFFIESNHDKKHLITVNHPAFGIEDSTEFYLWELRQDSNQLDGYFLDAESVICVDHSCKIVPVRMFWDPLGNYLKYELADGIILEKKEGKPFLPEDYDRLHEILQDKYSPYSELSYYEITHEKVIGEGQVDAVSGATAIILDETKTILGGAWTCYTLWHWAHGETVQEIKNLTGANSSINELLSHIKSSDHDRQLFALNELIERKEIDSTVVSQLIMPDQLNSTSDEIFKEVISYLQLADSNIYFNGIKQLLENYPVERRKLLWNSILNVDKIPPENYFDNLFGNILESKDYQEINLFLKVLEHKKASSPSLMQQMIPLLEEEYSIINRRVYWYLNQKELTNSQKTVLQSFYQKYSDYLLY